MIRTTHTGLRTLFILLFFTAVLSANSDTFTESGLVDIPTGNALKHGVFGAGTDLTFERTADGAARTLLGNAVAVRLNFGVLDRLEVGLRHTWHEDITGISATQQASLKLQLLREREVGTRPSIAIGVENVQAGFFSAETETPSAFLAVSKTFNLPRIHQFSGHIGVGTERFSPTERPIGVFAGLSKEFQPAFARGDITLNLEFDGVDVNLGLRYHTHSGLQLALGAESLNTPDELRYLAAVSWTNARVLEQLDEMQRLIKRATQLAITPK